MPVSTVEERFWSKVDKHPRACWLWTASTFKNGRIQSLRRSFLGGVVRISNELVSAMAIAGGTVNNYAVISLKTRLGSPDNQLGFALNGNGTSLIVPDGNVGGNYSARCSSSSNASAIDFPNSTLDQQIVVNEPQTASCTNSNITGGTIQQLTDYPIPDPAYFNPLPSWCTGSSSGGCQETGGNWPYAPSFIYL